MDGLYVYGITDRTDVTLPMGRGIGGRPIVALSYRDIAAVACSLGAGRAPAASPAAVGHHEEIVEALMAASTVLPARFGTVVSDEVKARELLGANYTAFVEMLRRVRGRVELGLRVLWPGDGIGSTPGGDSRAGPPPASAGTAYVLARLEEERRARAARSIAEGVAHRIHRPLAAIAYDSARETLPTPRTVFAAAYLVDGGQVERMRREVSAVARSFTTLRFLLTGPWPPYSFCAGASSGEIVSHGGPAR
ncbi:MAG: GvpL/GvpF family gas vesicle protein [Chloroflexi bacterium]|nr:GvpL/GvpF family gas vesicle protein [Chloroflexota bacterium]